MSESNASWTDDHVIETFFWYFEWASGRRIDPSARAGIANEMQALLSQRDPTAQDLINRVVGLAIKVKSTPSRRRAALLSPAREGVSRTFEDPPPTGSGRIVGRLRDALHGSPDRPAAETARPAPEPPIRPAPVTSTQVSVPRRPVYPPADQYQPSYDDIYSQPKLADQVMEQHIKQTKDELMRDLRHNLIMKDLERAGRIAQSMRS
jgi:hypothetical protein